MVLPQITTREEITKGTVLTRVIIIQEEQGEQLPLVTLIHTNMDYPKQMDIIEDGLARVVKEEKLVRLQAQILAVVAAEAALVVTVVIIEDKHMSEVTVVKILLLTVSNLLINTLVAAEEEDLDIKPALEEV